MGEVRASVVICTHNRSDYLRAAISSLLAHAPSAIAHEVLVVDNASTDGTRRCVEELQRGTDLLRYVEEPTLGLSHARNRGIEDASGDIVAFLDDDAVASPPWLDAVMAAFDEHPDAAALGGRVDLIWPSGRRPHWLPKGVQRDFGGTDFGTAARPLVFPEAPIGANMAFRREVLKELGGFNPNLGRKGRLLVSGEEQELFQRIAARGDSVWYEPRAQVDHHVTPDRGTRRWYLRRNFFQGWTLAITANDPESTELALPSALRGRAPLRQRITELTPIELAAKLATRAGYGIGRLRGAGRTHGS